MKRYHKHHFPKHYDKEFLLIILDCDIFLDFKASNCARTFSTRTYTR